MNEQENGGQLFAERRQGSEVLYSPDVAKIKTGLHFKFTVAMTLVMASIVLVLFIFFHQNLIFSLQREADSLGSIVAQAIAQQFNHFQTESDWEIATQSFAEVQGLSYIEIIHPDGTMLQTWSDKRMTSIPRLTKGTNQENNPGKKINPLSDGRRMVEYRIPIVFGSDKHTQALARIGFIFEPVKGKVQIHSITIIMFIFAFVILGSSIAWVFAHIIIEPIQRLARAMKLVANEEVNFDENGLPISQRFRRVNDFDLNIHTQDEIEQLAEEFLGMLAKLEKTYQQLEQIIKDKNAIVLEKTKWMENLKELNRKNEMIIKERTREVVEKNLRLYEIFEELQFQKEELISMNAQLEKISRMKSEFLANMSHELRTPMNSILGFTEVLREKMFGDLNEKQEKYLYNIHTSGRHLLQLINNILDISKVEAGKMKLVIEPYAINRVIEEVQNTIRTLAYKKNIDLRAEVPGDITIYGDASKFKQILYNLLSNAIKFTEEKGEIVVKTQEIKPGHLFSGGAGAEAFKVEKESVLLTVQDNGIGIKPDDQERIFIEFEQADQTRKRRYEGTGLGLALTKKLVHLHKGMIWLQSVPDEGTTVFVVLPVQTVDDENQEEGFGV